MSLESLFFKLALVSTVLAFFLVLFKFPAYSKSRIAALFAIYLVYFAFQLISQVDYFPFTSFSEGSFPNDKPVRYCKLVPVNGEGTPRLPYYKSILPVLHNAEVYPRIKKAIFDPWAADEFAKVYAKAYEIKGTSALSEIRFERWKWDFVHDPEDPDFGYEINKAVVKLDGHVNHA